MSSDRPHTGPRRRLLTSPTVLPLVFFAFALILSFLLWSSARRTRLDNVHNETIVTAEQIKHRLEAWVDSRTAVLQHMATMDPLAADIDLMRFERRALQFVELYPGFQAINFIDPEGVIRIVVPAETNQAALNKDLRQHPDPRVGEALDAALASGEIRRSPLIHLLQGKPGFATYLPIQGARGQVWGVLNGVFNMDLLVDSCLSEETLRSRFAITIETPEGQTAYRYCPEEQNNCIPKLSESLRLRIVDKDWLLTLNPLVGTGTGLLDGSEAMFLGVGGFLGLALSILLGAYLRRVAELSESREDFKLLIETQPDVVVKLDSERRVFFVSPSGTRLMKMSEEQILGRPAEEFFVPEDHLPLDQFMEDTLAGHSPDFAQLRLATSGGPVWTSWTATAIFGADGSPQGMVAVGRDISRHRELELQLQQGQKLQAVGQLAGGVAHDFNNIIQAIIGYLGFVKGDLEPGSESYNDLDQAEKAAERAASLTRQLLAFSRRQMLHPVLLDLNRVTSELMPMLRRLLGEGVELEFHPGQGQAPIRADRSQVEQILVNLCVNARDALPGEVGNIHIQIETITFDVDFCRQNNWAETGDWVRLSLSDSGVGMAPETLAKIFEPFFTTKETGRGTGLGLSTVYGIVKQHEGLINVESQPGQGTTFAIHFRAAPGEDPGDEDAVATTSQKGSETILLVEDQEMVRNLAVRILQRGGYTVLSASNGIEGLGIWKRRQAEIDMVVMDVVMPRMGGREMSRLIRQEKSDVRILFISGYDSDALQGPTPLSENEDMLLKPFNQASLLERVREILDR